MGSRPHTDVSIKEPVYLVIRIMKQEAQVSSARERMAVFPTLAVALRLCCANWLPRCLSPEGGIPDSGWVISPWCHNMWGLACTSRRNGVTPQPDSAQALCLLCKYHDRKGTSTVFPQCTEGARVEWTSLVLLFRDGETRKEFVNVLFHRNGPTYGQSICIVYTVERSLSVPQSLESLD